MGISAHSVAKTLYLFSTYQPDWTAEANQEAHDKFKDYLNAVQIPYVETEGTYDKLWERGFLVSAACIPVDIVQMYCLHGKQEAYITLDNHKHGIYKAYITDVQSNTKTFLGYMRSISYDVVQALDIDYTYRPDLKMYWTVWPTDTTQMQPFEEEISYAKVHGFSELKRLVATADSISLSDTAATASDTVH